MEDKYTDTDNLNKEQPTIREEQPLSLADNAPEDKAKTDEEIDASEELLPIENDSDDDQAEAAAADDSSDEPVQDAAEPLSFYALDDDISAPEVDIEEIEPAPSAIPDLDEAKEEDIEGPTPEEANEEPEEEPDTVDAPTDIVEKKKSRLIDSIFDFVELFVFTLVGVLVISSFFFRQSIVDGGSMKNTLNDGEKLIISDFMYTPECGDIIVCEDYSTALKKPIVKRVIAVGGQTIKVTPNAIYVDGVKLDEPYVYIDVHGYFYDTYPSYALMDNETLEYFPGVYYQLTVPEGELFVMGDHRNSSTDSREIGTVDEDSVLGKVILRFYPFDLFGKVD